MPFIWYFITLIFVHYCWKVYKTIHKGTFIHTYHLSPAHHSLELYLLWKSQEVWQCSCRKFGDIWSTKQSIVLATFLFVHSLAEVFIPHHRNVTGGWGDKQTDTKTLPLTDYIGLGADSVKIHPYWLNSVIIKKFSFARLYTSGGLK